MLTFKTIEWNDRFPSEGHLLVVLKRDRWDDWAKYATQFQVRIFDAERNHHDLGDVKIGERGLKPGGSSSEKGVRRPSIDGVFNAFADDHFSLGQDETYYETLNRLPETLRIAYLQSVRDIAFNLSIFDSVEREDVTQESLLRSVSATLVRTRLHRLSSGDSALTRYAFQYIFPALPGDSDPPVIDFDVLPRSALPTNVHVLIGRNAVGKTRLMQDFIYSLTRTERANGPQGRVARVTTTDAPSDDSPQFSALLLVSFSAFDEFDPPTPNISGLRVGTVGLRHTEPKTGQIIVKSPEQLTSDFVQSFETCRTGLRRERWRDAISMLYSDPVFADANPLFLLEESEDTWKEAAPSFFRYQLSSGHRIVLLTVTRLVELVDEGTLVLLDEPEGHLHPPLLSALIRVLSRLLTRRNGVALVATHSPVVLQEVPSNCVWVLQRSGRIRTAERPAIETFGEGIGVLTREVFGLEVTKAGYHMLIAEAAASADSFEDLVSSLGNRLGNEAMALARGLMLRSGK